MLYYLFDITVTITNENNQNSYSYGSGCLAVYPDGTERKTIEADAERIMDEFADTCGANFCREFSAENADVQTDLNAYILTEEEYNHFKENSEEGE